jgi:hypothetical protein
MSSLVLFGWRWLAASERQRASVVASLLTGRSGLCAQSKVRGDLGEIPLAA